MPIPGWWRGKWWREKTASWSLTAWEQTERIKPNKQKSCKYDFESFLTIFGQNNTFPFCLFFYWHASVSCYQNSPQLFLRFKKGLQQNTTTFLSFPSSVANQNATMRNALQLAKITLQAVFTLLPSRDKTWVNPLD